jgi:hypothetical protein
LWLHKIVKKGSLDFFEKIEQVDLKGPDNDIEFKYFDKKWKILGLNKNWFMNFEDEPLTSCRLCLFSRGEGENIWEKLGMKKTRSSKI